MIVVVVAFFCGLGIGAFGMNIIKDPGRIIRQKADIDIKDRLGPDGKPKDPRNDYERHLYARHLRKEGSSMAEVAKALAPMITDVPAKKRAQYMDDILHSTIVGFKR